jgi:predicted membrane protein
MTTVPERTDRFSITPRLIVGLFILVLGTLWTLDNLNILESEDFTQWWPVVLIAIGASQFMSRRTNRVGPVLWMLAGAFLLAITVFDYDFDLGDLIPLAIAIFGAKLVWDALSRRSAAAGVNDDSTVNSFAVMAGVHWQSTSRAFRGGEATAIMGGVEIDLRNVEMATGEEVIIDGLAVMGGIEIMVPMSWRVVANVLPIMGGFEDKTRPGDSGPTLTVRGTAIMGAIVVQN